MQENLKDTRPRAVYRPGGLQSRGRSNQNYNQKWTSANFGAELKRHKNALVDNGPIGIERGNFEAQLTRCIIANKWSISCVDNIEVKRIFRCLDAHCNT